MQTTERPPTGPARGGSPVRGVVLVAVAVVLGFFVLRAIDDTGSGTPVAGSDPASSETTAGGDTTEAPATTAAPRAPAEVIVIVANASGVQGAAAEQTEAIQGGGYQVAPAANAPEAVEATQVMPVPGFEAEAAVLAADIGAAEGAVVPLPDPPPVDLAGANILVLLGPDLAG
jgi:hypothetical protein